MDDVGTPPSEKQVARISQWHVAHIISRITLIQISLRTHMARFFYPDYLKEEQPTLISKNIRTASTIHPDDQHGPPGYDCPDHWLKYSKSYTLSQQAYHGPRSATCRVKGQVEVTTSHFPQSFHMITYHDLWQPHHLPRSLSNRP